MQNIKKFHPGVYLKDSLEVLEMTASEFSARTGISERTLSALMNGKGDITFEIAYNLAIFFGNSINYWTNLQNIYDLYLREEKNQLELEYDWELIQKNSLKKYLLTNKYIEESDSKEIIVKKARELVGVNCLSLLEKKDSFACLKEQHTKNECNPFMQNFWISLALREARNKNGIEYNKSKLKEYIPTIRSLTMEEPSHFYPKLESIFEECGISFVLLPYLPKSNIYGVTKWFSRENVMLAVSNRGEKADLFWFTIFHEISHVLMEHRREALINYHGVDDEEADQMATDMLIPKKDWDKFISNSNISKNDILDFSKEINVLPCIVLGRLHKEKIIPYGVYDNSFNVSYKVSHS